MTHPAPPAGGADGLSPAARALLAARRPAAAPAQPDGRGQDAPPDALSPAQRRLWIAARLAPHDGALLAPRAFELRGPLDADALRRALAGVIARHEPLRTVYRGGLDAGEPTVIVLAAPAASEVALPVVDLASEPGPAGPLAADARVRARAAALAGQPVDLAVGPMLRAELLRFAPDRHVLLYVVHHLAFDGTSVGVLLGDLAALYATEIDTATDAARERLTPLPRYGDLAARARAAIAPERAAADAAYWRARLADAPQELWRAGAASVVQARHADRARTMIPTELARGIRVLARESGTTPFVVLLAQLALLVSRLRGTHDVLIGAPVAQREREGSAGLVGCFVQVLPLRCRVPASGTVRTQLAETQRVVLDALAHQAGFAAPDAPAGTPAVVLNMRPERARATLGAVVEAVELSLAPAEAVHDLALEVVTDGERLELVLDHAVAHVSPAEATRLLDRLLALLAAAVADPERAVDRLSALLPGEESRLRELARGDVRPELLAPRLDALVLAQCARTPDAVAVEQVDDDGRTTGQLRYGELAAAARALAARIRAAAAVAPEVVGVCLERRLELAAAQLGVLLAGSAFLPLDPQHPGPFVARLVASAGAELVVTTRELRDRLLVPAGVPRERCLCTDEPASPAPTSASGPHAAALAPAALAHRSAEALAYVIHTSGSTGEPKGVEITHGGVASYLLALATVNDLRPGDRLLHTAALGFDVAIRELFAPLLRGATTVLRSTGMTSSPHALLDGCARAAITVLSIPTALWHELLRPDVVDALTWPACLHTVSIGGEAALAPAVARWEHGPGRRLRLVNNYGPTETTIDVTRLELPAGSTGAMADGAPMLSIGRPLPNLETWVLGPAGEILPPGATGELYVGGPQLARGYRGRPDLTAERFAVHPQLGGRLYRTGDRVHWRPDGLLAFHGRIDAQLKVRGHRVEPAAVEAALLALPGVAGAAVVAEPAPDGDARLAAFVVTAAGGSREPGAAELRAQLAERVPSHLVPATITIVPALPRNANGKLDRAALGAIAPSRVDDGAPPATPMEQRLGALWCELLALPSVGRDAHFFDRGGHSLLVMRLAARVHASLGVTVPPRLIFDHPTLREQAAQLETLAAAAPAASDATRLLAALAELEALDDAEVRARLTLPALDPPAR